MHGEPAHEGIEPAGAGRFFGVHAEAVTAMLIEVKFDRFLGSAPALDQPEAAIGEVQYLRQLRTGRGSQNWLNSAQTGDLLENACQLKFHS